MFSNNASGKVVSVDEQAFENADEQAVDEDGFPTVDEADERLPRSMTSRPDADTDDHSGGTRVLAGQRTSVATAERTTTPRMSQTLVTTGITVSSGSSPWT